MSIPPRLLAWRRLRTRHSPFHPDLSLAAQELLYREEISGVVLMVATALALIAANSPWRGFFEQIWSTPITLDLGIIKFEEDFRHWINDLFMAFFFLQVGLHIKEEIAFGHLSSRKKASLPAAMAVAGMILPAILFLAVTWKTPQRIGWAIPMATDVAFALGITALLGDRVRAHTRLLLMAVAVVDDIGSIAVIALFYTRDISWTALLLAVVCCACLFTLRLIKARSLSIYFFVGLFLWAAIFKSGVHATLSGVILAAFIPARRLLRFDEYGELLNEAMRRFGESEDESQRNAVMGEIAELTDETESPLERLLRQQQPWIGFLVLPLFALANAGVNLSEFEWRQLTDPLVLGILLGLVIGKPLGVLGGAWLALRLGLAEIPHQTSWRSLTGLGVLSGIGFTVSLFIGDLSFEKEVLSTAKAGILLASLVMALAGFLYFRLTRVPASAEELTSN